MRIPSNDQHVEGAPLHNSGKTGHPLLNAGEMSKCKAQSYRIFPHLKTLGMVLFRPNIQEGAPPHMSMRP